MLINNLVLNKYFFNEIYNRNLGIIHTRDLLNKQIKLTNIRNYATLEGQYKNFFIVYETFVLNRATQRDWKNQCELKYQYPLSLEILQEYGEEYESIFDKNSSAYPFSKDSLQLELLAPRKKILFIYVIDGYYSSFKELCKLSYENLSQELTEYLNHAIECSQPPPKKNIFSQVEKDWEDLSKQPNKIELREFKEFYPSESFKTSLAWFQEFREREYSEVPLEESFNRYYDRLFSKLDVWKIRKKVEQYLKLLRSSQPEKEFYYALLPYRIPFHHLITNSIFEKDLSVINWELQSLQESCYHNSLWQAKKITYENKIIQIAEYIMKCIKNNLDKLLAQDFSIYNEKIFIIFALEAPIETLYYFDEVTRVSASYQEFRLEYLEYLDSAIKKKPLNLPYTSKDYHALSRKSFPKDLPLPNPFGFITKYWNDEVNFDEWVKSYSQTLFDRDKVAYQKELEKDYNWFCLLQKVEKEKINLIHQYMENLKKALPEKVINYIIIPYSDTDDHQYYMIL